MCINDLYKYNPNCNIIIYIDKEQSPFGIRTTIALWLSQLSYLNFAQKLNIPGKSQHLC